MFCSSLRQEHHCNFRRAPYIKEAPFRKRKYELFANNFTECTNCAYFVNVDIWLKLNFKKLAGVL